MINQINNATGDTPTETKEIYTWKQMSGQKASSSGTIYGIYDLSGGLWERTAAYTANNSRSLTAYGKSLLYNGSPTNETSTKYAMVYAHSDTDTSEKNYEMAANKRKFGNAIAETSTAGTGNKICSWYENKSLFVEHVVPFSFRGGRWSDNSVAGLFWFDRGYGYCEYGSGFRAVLVAF